MFGVKLLLCGLALVILAIIGAVVAAVFFVVSGRRLRQKLVEEFGEKRH